MKTLSELTDDGNLVFDYEGFREFLDNLEIKREGNKIAESENTIYYIKGTDGRKYDFFTLCNSENYKGKSYVFVYCSPYSVSGWEDAVIGMIYKFICSEIKNNREIEPKYYLKNVRNKDNGTVISPIVSAIKVCKKPEKIFKGKNAKGIVDEYDVYNYYLNNFIQDGEDKDSYSTQSSCEEISKKEIFVVMDSPATDVEIEKLKSAIFDIYVEEIKKAVISLYKEYKLRKDKKEKEADLSNRQLKYNGFKKFDITIESIEEKPAKTGKTYLLVKAKTDDGYLVCWNEFWKKDLAVGDRWNIGASIYMAASNANPYNRLDKVYMNNKL